MTDCMYCRRGRGIGSGERRIEVVFNSQRMRREEKSREDGERELGEG